MSARRKFLMGATSAVGAVGTAAIVAPFVASWFPSERAKAAGAPVEVEIGTIEPGMLVRAEWRGQPVWIVKRTPEMLATLDNIKGRLADPDSKSPQQPSYAQNATRSIRPDLLVLVGICTHLGCSPTDRLQPASDWVGGFYCPCHGSIFDLAGRVFSGMPAPTNLVVPPYMFVNDNRLRIGEDSKGA
ncbi:MAG: ubiquinol-cytochrome c reductase iron-sulfur subunit [Proteobacteria bacterium]|nr:ubiquinol-cytochrome c reductase iron-sulfur subunit [Burkholderiales bacterium]